MADTKYQGTSKAVQDQLAVINAGEGFPKQPSFVGAGCAAARALDPMFGVTVRLAAAIDNGDGTFSVELPADIAAKYAVKLTPVVAADPVVDQPLEVVDAKP